MRHKAQKAQRRVGRDTREAKEAQGTKGAPTVPMVSTVPTARISARTGKPVRTYTKRAAAVGSEPRTAQPKTKARKAQPRRSQRVGSQRRHALGASPLVTPVDTTSNNAMPGDFQRDPVLVLLDAALDLMKAACRGVGGVFREQDARACVRAVRAVISEVKQATPEPQLTQNLPGEATTGSSHPHNGADREEAAPIATSHEPWDDGADLASGMFP